MEGTKAAYRMVELEIVAPHTTNAGERSEYPQRVREALPMAGITGWTEHTTTGVWNGKRESGTLFQVYVEYLNPEWAIRTLAPLLARAMPDQEAIQVVRKGEVLLYEVEGAVQRDVSEILALLGQ